ncbi:hypothetical protein ACT3CE_00985 [Marinifilum sp. RC60d5]|uniref:hypothetical protein n=1 Tax=Marinifilum sp. RC60d5 TaxID=3458414 RepID=UPI002A0A697C|nr:hypothetical protein [uncultured Marinifilum sp.]
MLFVSGKIISKGLISDEILQVPAYNNGIEKNINSKTKFSDLVSLNTSILPNHI